MPGDKYFDFYLDGKRDAKPAAEKKETRVEATASEKLSAEQIFQRRDANRDGAVTLEEYLKGRTGPAEKTITKRFRSLDRNGDGVWDTSER